MIVEKSDIAGIVGILHHASTNGAVDACAHAVAGLHAGLRELQRLGHLTSAAGDAARSAGLLASIRSSTSYAKGMKLELAAERWVGRHGIDARRNTLTDLVLRDGTLLRPDFFAPGARYGALFIGEVKNKPVVWLTDQLRNYRNVALANDVPLHLFVRRDTHLTQPLQQFVDTGSIVRINLGKAGAGHR